MVIDIWVAFGEGRPHARAVLSDWLAETGQGAEWMLLGGRLDPGPELDDYELSFRDGFGNGEQWATELEKGGGESMDVGEDGDSWRQRCRRDLGDVFDNGEGIDRGDGRGRGRFHGWEVTEDE